MEPELKMYQILTQLKNRNITQETIIPLLSQASKHISNITDIKKHNKDLLFFACFNDTENLFTYLAENYKKEFRDTFKDCVIFVYVNKNPIILKSALNSIDEPTIEEKQLFIERFSHNCYRYENQLAISPWLLKNLDELEKQKFIELSFKSYNKPLLETFSLILDWQQTIFSYQPKNEHEKELLQFLIRYSSNNRLKEHKNQELNLDFEIKAKQPKENIEEQTLSSKTNQDSEHQLIIKKKRRVVNPN